MKTRGFRVYFSPLAERDLREAWLNIAQHDEAAADRFFDAVKLRSLALGFFPRRGRKRDDLQAGLRMVIEGRYLIFYRIEGDEVRVVRLLHGAQNLVSFFP
jgi:toxin ParE1/3/4